MRIQNPPFRLSPLNSSPKNSKDEKK